MSHFFFGFCSKLARTKTKQSTEKASEHNRRTACFRVLTGMSTLYFILYSFYFHAICNDLPFLIVPSGEIPMTSLQSWLQVCLARWDTVAATTAYPGSDTPGQGRFLCQPFLVRKQRRSRFLDPTVAISPGVGHHCNFLITPPYPFFPTSPVSHMSP